MYTLKIHVLGDKGKGYWAVPFWKNFLNHVKDVSPLFGSFHDELSKFNAIYRGGFYDDSVDFETEEDAVAFILRFS